MRSTKMCYALVARINMACPCSWNTHTKNKIPRTVNIGKEHLCHKLFFLGGGGEGVGGVFFKNKLVFYVNTS